MAQANAQSKEVSLRKFLRAQFGAKVATDRKGNDIISLRGRKGVAQIANPDKVLSELAKQTTLIKASTKGCVFSLMAAGRGKQRATISLLQVGRVHVLTMKAL